MSRVITVSKAAAAVLSFIEALVPEVVIDLSGIQADIDLAEAQPDVGEPFQDGYRRGNIDGMVRVRDLIAGAVSATLDTPDAEALEDALLAEAMEGKTARGPEGGVVSKAVAKRGKVAKIAKAKDVHKAKQSESWIDQQLKAAQARTKKFGATGGLKTGNLSPVQLVHRIKKNFRKRK